MTLPFLLSVCVNTYVLPIPRDDFVAIIVQHIISIN